MFTMRKSLLVQLKERRLALGLKQNDMLMRAGISRQQYNRLESKGNPRLATLELVAAGLNSEVLLIPKEKLSAVYALLEADNHFTTPEHQSLVDDPWQGLLGDDL